MKKITRHSNLFPLNYKGKLWKEKDCHELFLAFYNDRQNLTSECAVYIANGDWVFPDGTLYCSDDDEDNSNCEIGYLFAPLFL